MCVCECVCVCLSVCLRVGMKCGDVDVVDDGVEGIDSNRYFLLSFLVVLFHLLFLDVFFVADVK